MRLDIISRRPFAPGTLFGAAGAYERIDARAHYAVDPKAPGQAPIVDIALAPVGADGLVRFSGDVTILRPANGNRRVFFDWGNRGDKRALIYFNDGRVTNDPLTAEDAGNGYLLRRGYTVVWGAWQGDILPGDGRMVLDLPVAHENGRPVEGPLRVEYVGKPGLTTLPLSGWANTRSHPVVPGSEAGAVLTRKPYADAPREVIPRARWSFARVEGGVGLDATGTVYGLVPSRENIHLPEGFRSGWIHELIYTGSAPLVLGLGHAAVRDLVAWLRYDPEGTALLGPIERAYGWGRSQTGRAIRDYIYHGFNDDGAGRRVFDGLLPHVAGAGRLNTFRFANLTVPAGQQHEDHWEPADAFPFAYAESTDHLTGVTDAILKRPATDPLVFHTQTSTEYWQRRGSLVHTDTEGRDLPIPPNVRVHLWSGSQHAASPHMGAPKRGVCQHLENVVATTPFFRATLDQLDAWATHGTAPPPSQVPTRAEGTLVDHAAWRGQFPAIPAAAVPRSPSTLHRIDHATIPPTVHPEQYAVLVASVDADGNEIAGLRAPMVAAPLATYAGWNIRAPGHGHGAMHEFSGSTLPFPSSEAERAATGDPRPSVQARYPTPEAYVAAIRAAAEALVAAGHMLAEDVERIVAAAADYHRPRHDVRF